jgi:hypothetical protein
MAVNSRFAEFQGGFTTAYFPERIIFCGGNAFAFKNTKQVANASSNL